MKRALLVAVLSLAAAIAFLARHELGEAASAGATMTATVPAAATGIHKIKHVVVIMQENRSFDTYFGTYPGADGIPMRNGVPTVCVPDPRHGGASSRSTTRATSNGGGPHGTPTPRGHRRRADGRLRRAGAERAAGARCAATPDNPACAHRTAEPDVMGYHDAREIPNYWAYARDFVLQDHMFEPDALVEPARAPVPGLRLVGAVHGAQATR